MSTPVPPRLDPVARARLRAQAPRTWQRMLSGRRLNLIDPSPLDIEIEDIALGLSRNTRWNGQTLGDHGWSVAQHSLLVADIVATFRPRPEPRVLLAALLHDASEYVTHDLITPLKAAVGDVFRELEDCLMCAVHVRFGLPARSSPEVHALIKRADRIAAATEAVQLAGFSPAEVRTVLEIRELPLKGVTLVPLPVAEVRRRFLETFHHLEAEAGLTMKEK
ncbi:HD domain-containing protein [Pararhodospirillum oryzae]|uniref:Phosphohydrolase n=1 Tax=Pararhodospirillum oryzae TaxID=478448 RepID=A0A512H9W9_9PROT|nr:HD family hydrolase [Pararhodospirillum oryzae]GEO82251.1 phosphohydrolase [Pararhodospirillum oryzae]